MSSREQLIEMLNQLSETQIECLKRMLICLVPSLADDEYCAELYKDYLSDSEEDKNDNVSIEDFALSLGLTLQ